MKPLKFFSFIYVDEYSATPKYLQLSNSVIAAVEAGKLQKDDLLPSINEVSFELEISRDTVEKSYKYLKKIGVLGSVPGKGFYISNDNFKQSLRVFLLFNKLSTHKKIVYDAFAETLGEKAAIDFYIYNNDFSLFKKLLLGRHGEYSHFVIIPHFIDGGELAYEIINSVAKEKLILLDKIIPGIDSPFAAVYENFEKDIYDALEKAIQPLSKYHTIKLIFPDKSYFPKEIVKGFRKFCQQYAFGYKLVNDIKKETIGKGEVYISLMEDDLVQLVEIIVTTGFKAGDDIGIISYNETSLKRIILNGITTISTDFYEMGKKAAELVLCNSSEHVEVPFYLNLRPSL